MKKIFYIFGIVILCFILQIYALNSLEFFGVKPNILLTLCVVLGIWEKPSVSVPFNFIIGIFSDIIFTFSIGKYLITYIVVTLIIIGLSVFYNKSNKGATILIVSIATVLAEYILGIYSLIKFGTDAGIFSITFVGFKGAIVNSILGALLTKCAKLMEDNK